jgi:hypothetical protein
MPSEQRVVPMLAPRGGRRPGRQRQRRLPAPGRRCPAAAPRPTSPGHKRHPHEDHGGNHRGVNRTATEQIAAVASRAAALVSNSSTTTSVISGSLPTATTSTKITAASRMLTRPRPTAGPPGAQHDGTARPHRHQAQVHVVNGSLPVSDPEGGRDNDQGTRPLAIRLGLVAGLAFATTDPAPG